MLSASTAGAVVVNADIVHVDVDFHRIIDFRHNVHRRKGGVAAGIGVKRRNTDKTVHALLAFEEPIGIMSLDGKGSTLGSCFFTGQDIEQFHFKTLSFGIAREHPQKHARPILGFRSARTSMKVHDGIVGIVFITEQHAQFQFRKGMLGPFQFRFHFGNQGVVLFFHGHFPKGIEVVDLRFKARKGIHF